MEFYVFMLKTTALHKTKYPLGNDCKILSPKTDTLFFINRAIVFSTLNFRRHDVLENNLIDMFTFYE